MRFDPTQVGWRIGHSHTPRGVDLWQPWDRTAGVIGPQGSGKTLDILTPALLQAPGAALVTMTKPEDLLPHPEAGHGRPDSRDRPGQIKTRHRVPWPTETEDQTHQVRPPGHQMPCAPIQTRSVNPHEHFISIDPRAVDLRQVEDIRTTIAFLHNGTHHALQFHGVPGTLPFRRGPNLVCHDCSLRIVTTQSAIPYLVRKPILRRTKMR